jgi:putative ABC transport system permease protein
VLPVNGHHFEEWRTNAQSFEAIAEYRPLSSNLTGGGEPIQIALVQTSGELFDVLQVKPILGRALRADDERRGAPDVVVIGNALWRDRLSADATIVDRVVTLDGMPHTVVGVLPSGFQLPDAPRLAGSVELTSNVDAKQIRGEASALVRAGGARLRQGYGASAVARGITASGGGGPQRQ